MHAMATLFLDPPKREGDVQANFALCRRVHQAYRRGTDLHPAGPLARESSLQPPNANVNPQMSAAR